MSAQVWVRGTLALVGLLWLVPALPAVPATAPAPAPVDFTLPGVDGLTHKLSDYRGKWVIVNYWATWCPPCLEELPELERFSVQNRNDAVVLGVNFERISQRRLKQFVVAHGIHYPVLYTEPTPMTSLGPVWGLPTTYIVDPKGIVVGHHTGPLTEKVLEEFIQSMERSAATRPVGH
ncbi:MAG: peroxiredoxin family protein [Gammaproteobacteria bacterium]|nr:TlpA disulfide reductase family protein [Gammaproteobacteria bacterium]